MAAGPAAVTLRPEEEDQYRLYLPRRAKGVKGKVGRDLIPDAHLRDGAGSTGKTDALGRSSRATDSGGIRCPATRARWDGQWSEARARESNLDLPWLPRLR